MKNILKQILIVSFFLVLVFIAAYTLVSIFVPLSSAKRLDTEMNKGVFGVNDAFQLVLNRAPLKTLNPKIIFIGSSNVRIGFRPEQFLTYFPDYEIHNMCVGGSNLSQVKKVIELAYEVIPQQSQNKTVFVLGLWYGNLVDDDVLWASKTMAIENEQMRYGLYHQKAGSIQPRIPQEFFPYYMKFLYPFLTLNQTFSGFPFYLKESFEALCRKILKGKGNHFVPKSTNVEDAIVSESDKERALNFWHQRLGADQYKEFKKQWIVLENISQLILKHGGKLVIVDMPLPQWNQNRSKDFEDYQIKKDQNLRLLSSWKDIFYINMQDLNKDEDYYDSAHCKPHATYLWSARLSKELKQIRL